MIEWMECEIEENGDKVYGWKEVTEGTKDSFGDH